MDRHHHRNQTITIIALPRRHLLGPFHSLSCPEVHNQQVVQSHSTVMQGSGGMPLLPAAPDEAARQAVGKLFVACEFVRARERLILNRRSVAELHMKMYFDKIVKACEQFGVQLSDCSYRQGFSSPTCRQIFERPFCINVLLHCLTALPELSLNGQPYRLSNKSLAQKDDRDDRIDLLLSPCCRVYSHPLNIISMSFLWPPILFSYPISSELCPARAQPSGSPPNSNSPFLSCCPRRDQAQCVSRSRERRPISWHHPSLSCSRALGHVSSHGEPTVAASRQAHRFICRLRLLGERVQER